MPDFSTVASRSQPPAGPTCQVRTLSWSWRQNIGIATFLAALALAAYYNSLDTPFVFDDSTGIVDNPQIRRLPSLATVVSASRGLTEATFSLNYAVSGLQVRSYHLTNVAIHVLAALALFGLVRRTLTGAGPSWGQTATGLSFTVAAIWLLHPLQTQSVTYTVQRLESLMGLFYFLTLYCFRRGVDARRSGWFVASVVSCALAMRAKEVAFTAPLMVLWYDRAFVSSTWQAVCQRKYYYLSLLGTCVLLMGPQVLQVAGHMAPQLTGQPASSAGSIGSSPSAVVQVEGMTPWSYLATQPMVILHYLRLSIVPVGLCLDYGWPVARSFWQIVPAGAVVVALLAATVWAVFRRPAWGFLGGWLFVILAPTSSIVPIQDVAFEHRMYLPLAAVCVAVVLSGYGLTWRSPRLQRSVAVAAVVVLGALTIARNYDYRSNEAMWRDVVTKRPDNVRAHSNFGLALAEQNKLDEAVMAYREALRLRPDYAYAHYNLGNAHVARQELEQALASFSRAIQLRPDYPQAHNNLGFVLAAAGRDAEAQASLERALKLKPDHAGAYVNLGLLHARQGKLAAAEDNYRRALEFDTRSAEAHNNLALVLARQRRLDDALAHWRQALAIKPDYAQAYRHMGTALAQLGRFDSALEHLREAIRLQPDSADAHRSLADALSAAGHASDAIANYRKALELDPEQSAAEAGLAAALAQRGAPDEALIHYRRSLDLQPEQGELHHQMANLLSVQRQHEDARRQYRRAAELLPHDASVWVNWGLLVEKLGEPDEAIKHYTRALKSNPDFAPAHLNLGSCLAARQQFEPAIRHFVAAVRLDPSRAEAHHSLANALARTGQLEQAARHYQLALQLRPNFEPARQNLQLLLQTLRSRGGSSAPPG